ncbi:hypothetical protein ACIRPH_31290 [Nocardiopsis sp. NPDC101807]|uniref:hypothetical protein n=1 Tax=Nocardiopsis sp. NPDC101807 TaxID=3364339 RepID=UPI0038042140
MDPLDTMTVTDWRRVYDRQQARTTRLLGDLAVARRREAELVDRLRRRDEENRQLSEQADLWEGRDRERLDAAARLRELEEENKKLRGEVRHWRTEFTDAKRVMDRRGEYVKKLKDDLSHATVFIFGDGLESFAEVTRDGSWTVRSWEPTERHEDQSAALSRAREIAGEEA